MKEKIPHRKISFTGGFTLVEALVAVSIVLVGVTATFGVAQFGLSSTSAVRNRVTAMYLAQEGLEAVKNIKDSNLQKISLDDSDINWLEDISAGGSAPCDSDSSCGYDINYSSAGGALKSCPELQDCRVQIDSNGTSKMYRQMLDWNGEDTGFIREIFVEEIIADQEARVTVVISIPDSSFDPFTVRSVIYNWF